ncbi:MAG: hypothetical protein H0V00_15360 [Chloroflexia bacterium]|nr:hypothetical protein [Chloroflexia bacterium]
MVEPRRDTDASRRDSDESFDQLTVPEAAERLGLSIDATRMRIRRGTLPTTLIEGKKYVLVARSVSDEPRPDTDATPIEAPRIAVESTPDSSELVTQLRSEVTYLRQTLDAEIEARRRADHLVAGMIDERRELTATITALAAGEIDHETDLRRNDDRTARDPQDALRTRIQGAPRDQDAAWVSDTLIGRLRRLFGR